MLDKIFTENKLLDKTTFYIEYNTIIQNIDFLILKYLCKYDNIDGIDLDGIRNNQDRTVVRMINERPKENIFEWLGDNSFSDEDYRIWKSKFPNSNEFNEESITDFIYGFKDFCYTRKSVEEIYIPVQNDYQINVLQKIFDDKFNLIIPVQNDLKLELFKDTDVDVVITDDEKMLLENKDLFKSKNIILPNQVFRYKIMYNDVDENLPRDILISKNQWEQNKEFPVSFINLYKNDINMYMYG